MIPYGRHYIDEDDVRAVADVMRGEEVPAVGGVLGYLAPAGFDAVLGIVAGAVVLGGVGLVKKALPKKPKNKSAA